MIKHNKKPGFTLIELTFAITFISILLIAIGWLTIHITSTYEKGLAIKAVNSTGKELVDDFSRAIAGSPAMTIDSLCGSVYSKTNRRTAYNSCVSDKASKLIFQQRYGSVKIKDEVKIVPVNGVFCTGRYSYIYNTAYALNTEDYVPTTPVNYRAGYTKTTGGLITGSYNQNFKLLKVPDFSRELCKSKMESDRYYYSDNAFFSANYEGTELLDTSDNELAIYDLRVFPPTVHNLTNAAFYSGTFILATLKGNINIESEGNYCSDPPDNLDTDFAYCAINKFNFAMRADGERTSTERR